MKTDMEYKNSYLLSVLLKQLHVIISKKNLQLKLFTTNPDVQEQLLLVKREETNQNFFFEVIAGVPSLPMSHPSLISPTKHKHIVLTIL